MTSPSQNKNMDKRSNSTPENFTFCRLDIHNSNQYDDYDRTTIWEHDEEPSITGLVLPDFKEQVQSDEEVVKKTEKLRTTKSLASPVWFFQTSRSRHRARRRSSKRPRNFA